MIQLLIPSNSSSKSFLILGIFLILLSMTGCQELIERDSGFKAVCRANEKDSDDAKTEEEIDQKCNKATATSVSEDATTDAAKRDDLFAGSGKPAFKDGNGANAQFNNPSGIVINNDGELFVADFGNHVIRKVTSDKTVTSVAGTAEIPGSTDGTDEEVKFNGPSAITIDPNNNLLYVYDKNNNVIRKIDLNDSGTTSTIGSTKNEFKLPLGLAVDKTGILYVADTENHRIVKVDTDGNLLDFVGVKENSGYQNGTGFTEVAPNTPAKFNRPWGITYDFQTDTLYVSDWGNHVIRKVAASTGVVTTHSGPEPPTDATADAISGNINTDANNPTAARYNHPTGLAVDSSSALYVIDADNNQIRKISSDGQVTTLPYLNTTADQNIVKSSDGIAIENSGNSNTIYISDTPNHRILRIIEAP